MSFEVDDVTGGLFRKKPTQTSCTIYKEKIILKNYHTLALFPPKWMAFYEPLFKKTAKHCNSFKHFHVDLAPHASAMAYRFEPPGATNKSDDFKA